MVFQFLPFLMTAGKIAGGALKGAQMLKSLSGPPKSITPTGGGDLGNSAMGGGGGFMPFQPNPIQQRPMIQPSMGAMGGNMMAQGFPIRPRSPYFVGAEDQMQPRGIY